MRNLLVSILPDTENNDWVNINFSGELTIQNLENEYVEIYKAVNKYNFVRITLSQIIELDLAFIQFMYVMKKTDKTTDKTVQFSIELPTSMQNLVRNSGFEEILSW